MRDIRTMEPAWEKVSGGKFSLAEYLDDNQQLMPEYHLTNLQEKLAFTVNMGYIRSFNELVSEMRRVYRVMVFTRNTSKISSDLSAPPPQPVKKHNSEKGKGDSAPHKP